MLFQVRIAKVIKKSPVINLLQAFSEKAWSVKKNILTQKSH